MRAPTYERQGTPQTPSVRNNTDIPDISALTYAARPAPPAERRDYISGSLNRLAVQVAHMERAREEVKLTKAINEVMDRSNNYLRNPETGRLLLKGEETLGLAARGDKDYKALAEEVANKNNIKTKELRSRFDSALATHKRSFDTNLMNHESSQTIKARNGLLSTRKELHLQEIAGNAGNGEVFAQNMLQIYDLNNSLYEGQNPEVLNAANAEDLSNAHVLSITAIMAQDNLRGAKDYLEKYGDEIISIKRIQLEKDLNHQLMRAEEEWRRNDLQLRTQAEAYDLIGRYGTDDERVYAEIFSRENAETSEEEKHYNNAVWREYERAKRAENAERNLAIREEFQAAKEDAESGDLDSAAQRILQMDVSEKTKSAYLSSMYGVQNFAQRPKGESDPRAIRKLFGRYYKENSIDASKLLEDFPTLDDFSDAYLCRLDKDTYNMFASVYAAGNIIAGVTAEHPDNIIRESLDVVPDENKAEFLQLVNKETNRIPGWSKLSEKDKRVKIAELVTVFTQGMPKDRWYGGKSIYAFLLTAADDYKIPWTPLDRQCSKVRFNTDAAGYSDFRNHVREDLNIELKDEVGVEDMPDQNTEEQDEFFNSSLGSGS